MEMIDITALRAGTRLSKAVFLPDGKLLFEVGEVLTEERLNILKKQGITTVAIETESPVARAQAAETPDDIHELVRKKMSDTFRFLDTGNPYIAAVFELSVERHSRAMLSKPGKISLATSPSPAFQTAQPPKVSMQSLIDASLTMGTLPMVFHRLVETINNPKATPNDIATIIATDPALAAKLLRLVNSPFYGLSTRIDTISRAVVLVGTGQLVMLAMSATLITAFKGLPVSLVNMQSFWSHSIGCGVAAKLLANAVGITSESFFIAGLLHDIARLLMYTQLPTHSLYLLTEAKRQQTLIHDLEQEALGFTHEELGAGLLRSWRCPEELVARVRHHHQNPLSDSATQADAILPLANLLSQALGFGSSGESYIPPVDPRAWELLGLTPDALVAQCHTMDTQFRELRSMLA